MDITCAHCGNPFDVWGLRHEGWGYIDNRTPARLAGIPADIVKALNDAYALDESTAKDPQRKVNNWLYHAVLSGQGCPYCGFRHQGEGKYREQQLRELVFDSVTDDDPMMFM